MTCTCTGPDAAAAKTTIVRSLVIDELVDESHFGALTRQCGACGQRFLTLFCERVDWADSDDPQTWIAAPITEAESVALRAADAASDENRILDIVSGERRILVHDMPKGAESTIGWLTRPLYIAAHD